MNGIEGAQPDPVENVEQSATLSVREPFIVSDQCLFGLYPNESCVYLKKRCVFDLLEADGRIILFADGNCYLNNKRLIFTPLKARNHRSFNFPLKNVEDETLISHRRSSLELLFRPSGVFGSNSERVPLLCRVILHSDGTDFSLSFLSLLLQIRFPTDVLNTKPYPVHVPHVCHSEPWYSDSNDSVHSTRSYPEMTAMASHIYGDRSVHDPSRYLEESLTSHRWKSSLRKLGSIFKNRHQRQSSVSNQSGFIASAMALSLVKQELNVDDIPKRARLAIHDPKKETLQLYEQVVDNRGQLQFAPELSIEKPSREYGPDSLHSSLMIMRKLSKHKTKTSSFASDAFLTLRFRQEAGR